MRLFESREMVAFAEFVKKDDRNLLPRELLGDWLEKSNSKPPPIPEMEKTWWDWLDERYIEVYKIVRMYLMQGKSVPEDILDEYQELQKLKTKWTGK